MKAKPAVRFADQSDEFRMFIRHAVGNFGCQVESYNDNGGITIAVVNDTNDANCLRTFLERAGLVYESAYYFPLGSDNPPHNMRHGAGYWKFQHYSVRKDYGEAKD